MVLANFGGSGSVNFGNMDANGLSTGTNFDPKDIRGKVNSYIKKNAILPTQVKPSDLLTAAKEKGGSDYALWAAQQMSNLRAATVNNVIGLEQTASSYAQSMMTADRRLQDIRAKHGVAEIQHGVQTGMNTSEYGGYKQSAQNHWDF
jgi:hypothetical protein